jgi:hypothetical protein
MNNVTDERNTYYEVYDGIQAIDVIKEMLSKEEYIGFLKGNVLKYQLRLGKKDKVKNEITKINNYKSEIRRLNENI